MSLSPYVPIIGLFALAAAFALFSVGAAPLRRSPALQQGQARGVRVRHRAQPAAGRRRPVPGQVLPDGDALHRLRHRDHLPLPVGGVVRRSGRSSASWRWSCSSSRSSSRTPTCGGAAAWTGTEEERQMGIEEKLPAGVLLTSRGEAGQLVPEVVRLGRHLRPGLLRHRDDGRRRSALRPGPLGHGGLPGLAPAGRPDDRGRPGEPEDGPGAAPDLRPDGRARAGCSRWASAPAAAACSTTTRSCRASTTSCRSTCTCPAARPGRRCSSTRSSSCARRSCTSRSGPNGRKMLAARQERGDVPVVPTARCPRRTAATRPGAPSGRRRSARAARSSCASRTG